MAPTPSGGERLIVASRSRLATRVFALGGVNADNARACAAAGADGVAVIRALYDAGVSGCAAAALALAAPFGVRVPPRG